MIIRKAQKEDYCAIEDIYAYARSFMERTGNKNQWNDGYPSKEIIIDDINSGNSYVCINDHGRICAVFYFFIGEDPTYKIIEQGKWLNNEPYGTIHRIASNGIEKGCLAECVSFCKKQINSIRIDTHEDNLIMQHLLDKNGFKKCGIIYTRNGSERIAYQLLNDK